MIDRVDKRLVFTRLNSRPFLHGETEPCINGRILGIGAYFKEPNDALANQLLSEQLEDGGWNCKAPKSRRSSFHTTICVLEGLLEYERAGRKSAAVTKARERAENYLLERRMFRSLRTGEVIDKRWLGFSFPSAVTRTGAGRSTSFIPNAFHWRWKPLSAAQARWNTLRALRVLRWYNSI